MNLEPIAKLTKDLKQASYLMTNQEARYLVDSYYQMQENRKRADNQIRSFSDSNEPHDVIAWLSENSHSLENQIKNALDVYSLSSEVGRWSRSITGIGPVIAAGLLAHIDITKAPTVGHIWRFAGLDPTCEWKKGERRPWNAALKTLCWKIGESFVKVCNNKNDVYGKYYLERKQQELLKNEAGEFEQQAKEKLSKFNIGKSTDAYKWYSEGKLPPAHIHARAKRYALKLFLSHWHEVAYKDYYKKDPPLPYPIAILNHAHKIEIK